jgi:hypothetical protein
LEVRWSGRCDDGWKPTNCLAMVTAVAGALVLLRMLLVPGGRLLATR